MAISPGSYKGITITGGTDADVAAQMKAIDISQPVTAAQQSPSTISSDTLEPSPTPLLPPNPQDTENYGGIIGAGTALSDYYKKVLEEPATPDLTSMMNQLSGQLGIDEKTQKYNESQKQLDLLNAQMAGLSAEADAVPIKVQQESIGRGVTAGGVQPIETARLRDIALRSLPLQGQILAQQAIATGDQRALEAAQNKFSTMFNIQLKQAEMQYNAKKEQRDRIYDLLTKAEQRQADALSKKEDREFELLKTNISSANTFVVKALENGFPQIAAKISALNPKSPTYQQDLATLVGQITPKAKEAAKTVEVGDRVFQWNEKTQAYDIEVAGGTATNKDNEALTTGNVIDNILNDNAFNSTFGFLNAIQRSIPGTEAYRLTSEVNNLIQKLALAARGQLKGQGAVSDFEGRMLKEAQTALKMNMTPVQAHKELAKVKGALRTSSGLTTPVLIRNPQTGESQILISDQKGINQAIKDGMVVEYQ